MNFYELANVPPESVLNPIRASSGPERGPVRHPLGDGRAALVSPTPTSAVPASPNIAVAETDALSATGDGPMSAGGPRPGDGAAAHRRREAGSRWRRV